MAQMLSTLASADVVLNVLNQSAPIVSNSLDSVGPDLGPNCLQRYSADNKSHCWQGICSKFLEKTTSLSKCTNTIQEKYI